jgi:hypothetical protein
MNIYISLQLGPSPQYICNHIQPLFQKDEDYTRFHGHFTPFKMLLNPFSFEHQ